MNRFERTHEELKRQLASLGIYDSDCPMEISLAVKEEINNPKQVQQAINFDQKEEAVVKADVDIAAS